MAVVKRGGGGDGRVPGMMFGGGGWTVGFGAGEGHGEGLFGWQLLGFCGWQMS